jgi:hypothetical protein
MVTPALERLFEAEGVGLIPLEGGARWFARELLHPADREVEIVVGGKFDRIPPAPVRAPAPSRPAPNRVKSNGASVGFECELSIERVPLLASHVFAGRPVLPVALAIEWLAHGALHAHPGLVFRGLDDLRVLKGVTLDNGAHPVRVVAGKAERAGEEFIVRVELVGGADYKTRHARADVILAAERQAPPAPNLKPALLTPYPRTPQAAYEDILFHGPALHAIESIEGWSGEGIAGRVEVAPPPEAWVADPPRDAWLADPAAVDAALQLAILWTFQRRGEVSLPSSIGAYRQYAAAFPRAGARVVLRVGGGVGSRTALADAEFLDDNGRTIARIDRLEMVMDASLMSAFRRRAPDAPATL